MFHRRKRLAQFYERLTQTLKNALYFLVELKPLFLESFQGTWTQFQSLRFITLRCHGKVCVTAVCLWKIIENQSWVNLLFSVSRDSILNSILNSLFSILDSRRNRESRLAMDCQLFFEQYCVQVKLFCCWKRTTGANFSDYSWRKHGFASIII